MDLFENRKGAYAPLTILSLLRIVKAIMLNLDWLETTQDTFKLCSSINCFFNGLLGFIKIEWFWYLNTQVFFCFGDICTNRLNLLQVDVRTIKVSECNVRFIDCIIVFAQLVLKLISLRHCHHNGSACISNRFLHNWKA